MENSRWGNDLLHAVIIYISKNHDTGNSESKLINMLTDLFDEKLSGIEKVKKLISQHNIPMTRELGKEVPEMCTYAEAMVLKGIEQGIEQEKVNTEREKIRAEEATIRAEEATNRAEEATKRAEAAEARLRALEAEIAAKNA